MFGKPWFHIRSITMSLVLSISAISTVSAQGPQKPSSNQPAFMPGQVIVKLKTNTAVGASSAAQANTAIDTLSKKYKAVRAEKAFKSSATATAGAASASVAPKAALENVFVLNFDKNADVNGLVGNLRAEAQVAYAEPNYIYTTSFVPNDPFYASSNSWGQGFDDLYGLKKMAMAAAWDVNKGAQTVVAVVDTGLDFTHPDIQGNIWINADEVANNGIDDDNNGFVDDVSGYDFIGTTTTNPNSPGANPDNDPSDGQGHGTHVSGTIAATGNNGIGVIGVAPQTKIMPVKGLDDSGSGLATTLANALIYAADNGADVINNSWGGYGNSSLINDAVAYAYAQGAVLVAAAGNENNPAEWPHPSKLPQVISVAALDHNDVDAPFSNWGAKVDVGAPGVSTLSLLAANSAFAIFGQGVVGQNYLQISGTSMAAPHVSGLAALLISKNPTLSQEQVRHIITQTADDVMSAGWDSDSGSGRVNAQKALNYAGVAPDFFVQITSPAPWAANGHSQEVRGTITGSNFSRYELAYARYIPGQPLTFVNIATGTSAGVNQLLTQWNTSSLASDIYILRLRAFNTNNRFNEARVSVRVDNQLKPGWASAVSTSGHMFGPDIDRAIAFEDLDNDGTKEVISFGDFTVNVWNANGQPRPGFPVTLTTPVMAGPTIVDLNNDGFKEIVVSVWTAASQAGPVWAFRHDGTVVPGFPAGRPGANQAPTVLFEQSPVIAADLEGDGQVELIYTIRFQQQNPNLSRNGQQWLGVLNANGSVKTGYPKLIDEHHIFETTHMSVVDIDQDNVKEIIISANSVPDQFGFSSFRYLRYYGANGALEREFKFNDKVFHFRDFIVADFNRNGDYEIFFSANVRPTLPGEATTQGYLIDRNGNFLPGWPVSYTGGVDTENGTIAANLDSDPELEIVEILDRQVMMAFNVNGTMVNGFPTAANNRGFSNGFVSAKIASVPGTVLIGNDSNWGTGLIFYNNLGVEVTSLRKDIPVGISSPAVGDLDNNGRLDIGINALDGRVYIWELDTPTGVVEPTEWPTLWADNKRSNYIPTTIQNPWKRTVVFIFGTTVSGQDMFVRGGIDHNYASTVLGKNCTATNFACAIPIRHLNLRNTTTTPWKAGDTQLDWYGAQAGQSTQSVGTPLDWTTNIWPSSWGTKRTVAVDGYGETPLNRWGQHYWMLDVEMDCSKTVNGWFELKSFISNGPGWEADVNQPGRPWVSGNHFAQCGKLNAFRRGESAPLTIENL